YAHAFHKDTLAATADVPALEKFAASLSMVFAKVPPADGEPDDQYSVDHSASMALLDPQGRMSGLVQPPFDPNLIAADLAALPEAAAPWPEAAQAPPTSLSTNLTYTLPHRLLSSLARRLAYSPHPRVRRGLIDNVTRRFGVDLSEASHSDPAAYPTFTAFFTRALRPGVRVVDPDPRALAMPADGRISQCGAIEA